MDDVWLASEDESFGVEKNERTRRMRRLMRELYKDEQKEDKKSPLLPTQKTRSLIVVFSFLSGIILGVTTLYNFNLFVTLEERVLLANSFVADVLQRRINLFENLINLTLNQAALEQEIFRSIAEARAVIGQGMEGEAKNPTENHAKAPTHPTGQGVDLNRARNLSEWPEEGLEKLSPMARLLAVAERFPNIRSSVTYQKLMDHLVEIEDRITARQFLFNNEAKIYNTLISSFPWNILAKITGFSRFEFHHVGGDMIPVFMSDDFKRLVPTREPSQSPLEEPRPGSEDPKQK